jgi:hypothetical protein
VVAVLGGNARMVTWKDMEQRSGLVAADTSGNGRMITSTGMEYTDIQVEMYITDSGNRIRKMAKDITGGQMVKNIGETTRMAYYGEREYSKRVEYYTEKNTKKASARAGVKYSDLIKSLSRNF